MIFTAEDVDRYNLYVEGACLSGVKETTQDVLVSASRIMDNEKQSWYKLTRIGL